VLADALYVVGIHGRRKGRRGQFSRYFAVAGAMLLVRTSLWGAVDQQGINVESLSAIDPIRGRLLAAARNVAYIGFSVAGWPRCSVEPQSWATQ